MSQSNQHFLVGEKDENVRILLTVSFKLKLKNLNNMKIINSHIKAQLALREGKKLKNIYYSDKEYVFLNLATGKLQTEDGYTHGGFEDEFWIIQKRLPEKWYVVI